MSAQCWMSVDVVTPEGAFIRAERCGIYSESESVEEHAKMHPGLRIEDVVKAPR